MAAIKTSAHSSESSTETRPSRGEYCPRVACAGNGYGAGSRLHREAQGGQRSASPAGHVQRPCAAHRREALQATSTAARSVARRERAARGPRRAMPSTRAGLGALTCIGHRASKFVALPAIGCHGSSTSGRSGYLDESGTSPSSMAVPSAEYPAIALAKALESTPRRGGRSTAPQKSKSAKR